MKKFDGKFLLSGGLVILSTLMSSTFVNAAPAISSTIATMCVKKDTGHITIRTPHVPQCHKDEFRIRTIEQLAALIPSVTSQGTSGDVGPQGATGAKGDTGAIGATGEKGDAGPQGPQGLKGDTGDQGPKGDAGIQGPKGDTGDQGPKGDTGTQGATGPQGPSGPQGPQGDVGPQGPQGIQGIQGPKGDQGEPGQDGNDAFSGGSITGLVTGCANLPAEIFTVYVDGFSYTSKLAADGSYTLDHVPADTYTLSLKQFGNVIASKSGVVVIDGQSTSAPAFTLTDCD